MLQIPGHDGEAVLEGCCANPDVFDSDRLASRFQCGQQIPGTNGFRLTQRKNGEATQNLSGDSLPKACTVRDAGGAMAKLGDADGRRHDIARRHLRQPLQKPAVRLFADDF